MNKTRYHREYMGVPCNHCGSHNTFVEVFDAGPEGVCWACSRPQPVPLKFLEKYSAE